MKNARMTIIVLLALIALFGGRAILPLAAYNLKAAFAPQPALLTSIGQSADVEMVKTLMTRAKLN
ncbi:MAG TPA: hypothetical protein PLM50_02520, partial [Rectinema sp.]|nr:hypothetical protein [Rectinema sp.]